MSLQRRLILSLALGVLSLAFISFALPLAAVKASGTVWDVANWGVEVNSAPPDTWWAASGDARAPWPIARAGHYTHWAHPLLDRIDMRRIIFTGSIESSTYFNQNTPPSWAATLSVDFREGFDQVISTATGWPFRAFRGDHWIRWSPPPAPAFPQITLDPNGMPVVTQAPMERSDSLWHVSDAPSGPWALPHAPMWAGLGGDLLAFGAFWFLVLSFSGLRRTLRRRRGLCTRCAYALKGLAPGSPCPECGQASAHSPSPEHSTT